MEYKNQMGEDGSGNGGIIQRDSTVTKNLFCKLGIGTQVFLIFRNLIIYNLGQYGTLYERKYCTKLTQVKVVKMAKFITTE